MENNINVNNAEVNQTSAPTLTKYTHLLKKPEREIIGRNRQMREILAAFARPELSNVLLLAEAGGGKTALVQGLMIKDTNRIYLEVQLSKMISDAGTNPDVIAEWLRQMFNEASTLSQTQQHEIVLFIDEFHQIVQLSSAAVEVLKPLLADSGTRGIRVIAATTFEEFQQYISSNQPLVERFQRIQLPQPNEQTVVAILHGMAQKYNVLNLFPDDSIFQLIYDYTNRYIPSQIQPRKSILVLDAMIGYHNALDLPINRDLLAQVLYDQQGVRINFTANADTIKDTLNKNVIHQTIATTAITRRLQICIADLNDKSKPMASMLFTGSTGVGKTEMAKQMTKLLFKDSQQLIRFDMSEYEEDNTVRDFENALTAQVWAHPYCILLLDEIEKANAAIPRLLLQVLDDARLSDRNGRTVSFINTYIILTTNAGAEVYKKVGQYHQHDQKDEEFLSQYEPLIKQSLKDTSNTFPAELLGRIDTIVPFLPIDEDTAYKIAKIRLRRLRQNIYIKHNIICNFTERVLDYLIGDIIDFTDPDNGGARDLVHQIEVKITTNVSEYINTHPNAQKIEINVAGPLIAENKHEKDSHASIIVSEII